VRLMRDPSPLVGKKDKAPSLPLLQSKTMSRVLPFFPYPPPCRRLMPGIGQCQQIQKSAPSLGESRGRVAHIVSLGFKMGRLVTLSNTKGDEA